MPGERKRFRRGKAEQVPDGERNSDEEDVQVPGGERDSDEEAEQVPGGEKDSDGEAVQVPDGERNSGEETAQVPGGERNSDEEAVRVTDGERDSDGETVQVPGDGRNQDEEAVRTTARELTRVIVLLAKAKVDAARETELLDRLKKLRESLDLGEQHKTVQMNIRREREVSQEAITKYKEEEPRIRSVMERLRTRLEPFLEKEGKRF